MAIKRLEQWCVENSLSLESVLPKTVLYVTVEPCIMCTAALRFGLPAQPKWYIGFPPHDGFLVSFFAPEMTASVVVGL